MTTPLSGAISMNDLNKELGQASPYNQTISLNDTIVRTLLGKVTSSTTISLSDAYGLSSTSKFTASNSNTVNIYDAAVAGGWNRSSAVEYTIPAGVYIWTDSTSTPALTTGGPFPGGLTIINKGYIMGKGGNGASCPIPYTLNGQIAGQNGGPAMSITTNCTIDNQAGYIGGGGGGGGGVNYNYSNQTHVYPGGGGAGGGQGGNSGDNQSNSVIQSRPGGAGGAIGASGSNGNVDYVNNANALGSGGGGGRIMPGAGGASANLNTSNGNYPETRVGLGGGAGGSGSISGYKQTGLSGAGGSGGAAGGVGSPTSTASAFLRVGGGGGGWGASGGAGLIYSSNTTGQTLIAAGTGGKAINVNGNAITWVGGFPSTRVFGGVY